MREKQSEGLAKKLSVQVHSGVTVEGDSKQYVGVGARFGNGPVTRIWLPASDATDARNVVSALLNAGLEFSDPSLIKRSVSEALKQPLWVPARVAVRNGWHGKQFVHDGEILGENEPPCLWVHQDFSRKSTGAGVLRNDDLIDFLDKNGPKSDFVICATLIAFAQPLLGMLTSAERAVIYIWGESRTGKTTLAKLINSLSKPQSDRSLFSFDATDRAFEERLHSCSDNVAVFDEMTVVSDEEIERRLSPFIYTASNGRGKFRSKGASFPDLQWRTTTVVNGEKDLNSFRARRHGSGQDARLMVLPVPTRADGGIWPKAMSEKKRKKKTETLDRLCESYSGHSYQRWLKYLASNYDKVKSSFGANVSKFALALAGEGADSLTLSRARRFAQLVAAGHELIEFGDVEWDASLPFNAIQRLYKADTPTSRPAAIIESNTRLPAIEILAHVGLGNIVPAETDSGSESREAFLRKWGGEQFVMINSASLSRFVTGPASDVASAFKAAGASKSSGSTPFFQHGPERKRYLRISIAELNRLAFGELQK